jgi:hypothetical protein
MNSGIAITYASTPDRLPIGKRYRPQGKWPVEAGVRQTSFLFQRVVYDGLEALAADLRHRISEGASAIVAGVPKTYLDLTEPHRKANENFNDIPQWLLALDVDGLPPAPGEEALDTPEAFSSGRAVCALRERLPEPFRKARAVAYATSSTGFDPDSNGKPTEGRARFRIVFLLWKPLPLAEQKRLVERLKLKLDLPFLDTAIYAPSSWHFIKRPTLPKGLDDPIPDPVRFEAGATLDPSTVFMILGVDPNHDPYKDHENAGRLLEVRDEDRGPLLDRLMRTLPNDIVDRAEWIGVGHALRGACAGAPYGLGIWLEWCASWTKGVDDPEEDERVWKTLWDGKAGVNHLIKLALETGTSEALEAVEAIRRAQGEWRQQQARTAFTDLTPEDLGEDGATRSKGSSKFIPLSEFAAQYKPLTYIVEGVLSSGSISALTAKTSHGKTAFLIQLALAVATGEGDRIIGIPTTKSRVAYLTFENPEGVRMRMIAAVDKLGLNMQCLGDGLMVCEKSVTPGETAAALKELTEQGGRFGLVIVDTLQAAFDGEDFNSNREVLDFVRRFRRVAAVPGRPAVVIAAHPVKNADRDNLVPYGGGAILNELDANMTIWKNADDTLELHWQRKLRGNDFMPKLFKLEKHEAPTVRDDKDRPVPLPVVRPMTASDRARRDFEAIDFPDALLVAMFNNPGGPTSDWAGGLECDRSKVSRTLRHTLDKLGLAKRINGHWALTPSGRQKAIDVSRDMETEEI